MPLSSEDWLRLEVLRREIYLVADPVIIKYLTSQIEELERKLNAQPTAAS